MIYWTDVESPCDGVNESSIVFMSDMDKKKTGYEDCFFKKEKILNTVALHIDVTKGFILLELSF